MTPQKDRRSGYLGRAKVTALLVISILSSLQDIIMEATDKLIVGNMIGPDAVSGTMLSSPILSFCATFEMLVSAGASVLIQPVRYFARRIKELITGEDNF